VAELLDGMGFEVELTKQTRDGGKDILAYMNTGIGRFLCLVEAKKYRQDRTVGVELVRTLYGTLCDYHANSAMLVTTSSFSEDARAFQKRHEYQLSLRDYGNILEWIQDHKARQ
jgi:restriction system protein